MITWGCSPRGIYNMGVFLGKSKGIFDVPGSACSLFENITGADYTQELIKSRFDMGTCGTPPLFAALNKTKEYVLVGTANYKYPPFYLIADSSIKGIDELNKKCVGINKFRTCPESVVKSLLTQNGLPVSSVNLLELVTPSRYIEAVKSGEIQAAVLWEPWVSYLERVYNWKILADFSKLGSSTYAYFIYARKSLVQQKDYIVKGYIEAYSKSMDYAKANLNELIALDYPMNLVGKEDVVSALKREVPRWNSCTVFDWKIAVAAQEELKEQGVIPKSFAYTDFLMEI